MGSAIISVLTARPVNRRVAMTGEITLRGDVLPIGGLKEKVLAAKLAGIHTIIVPRLNKRDLTEISETIKDGLTFHFVDHMDDVLKIALLEAPEAPRSEAPATVPSEQPATASV
jgi:ATP-dependent Lon protease